MADYKLQARISEELAETIKQVAETIQKENPGAEATVSTICRYALEDYIKRYNARKNKDTLFFEIPIDQLNSDEMCKLCDGIDLIKESVKNSMAEERMIERKSMTMNNFKNEKASKMIEDYEIKVTTEFFEDIEKAENLCEEKILGFIRKERQEKNYKTKK